MQSHNYYILYVCIYMHVGVIGGGSGGQGDHGPLNLKILHRSSIFAIENHLSLAMYVLLSIPRPSKHVMMSRMVFPLRVLFNL